MSYEVDITPKTHAIVSMQRTDMHVWLAICELVDNSIDAQATVVSITWDAAKKCLCVADNGIGAPNPSALVRIGDHNAVSGSPAGRFGVGANDAISALGKVAEVSVVRDGWYRTIHADFR